MNRPLLFILALISLTHVRAAEFIAVSANPQYADPVQVYCFDVETKTLLWSKALTAGEVVRSVDYLPDAGLVLIAGYRGEDKGFVDLRPIRALGAGKCLSLAHGPSLGVRYVRTANGSETIVYPHLDVAGKRKILEVPLDGSPEREFQGNMGDVVNLGTTYQAAIPWVLECQAGTGDTLNSGWGDTELSLTIPMSAALRTQAVPAGVVSSVAIMTQKWAVFTRRSPEGEGRPTFAINRTSALTHQYVSQGPRAGMRLIDDTVFVQIDEPKPGALNSRVAFWCLSDGKFTEVKAAGSFEVLAGLGNMTYIARFGQRLATVRLDTEAGALIVKNLIAEGSEYSNVHWGAYFP